MSRSKRKHKIFPITIARSEKDNKQIANRKLRRKTREKIKNQEENLPTIREISDIYNWNKDGHMYNPNATKRELRK
jgi:hypothetical protein